LAQAICHYHPLSAGLYPVIRYRNSTPFSYHAAMMHNMKLDIDAASVATGVAVFGLCHAASVLIRRAPAQGKKEKSVFDEGEAAPLRSDVAPKAEPESEPEEKVGGIHPLLPTPFVVMRRFLVVAMLHFSVTGFRPSQPQVRRAAELENDQALREHVVSDLDMIAAPVVSDLDMIPAAVVSDLDMIAAPEELADPDERTPMKNKHITIPLTRQRIISQKAGGQQVYKSAYYATFTAGTPAVDYDLLLDTGSGHMILPSAFCQSETCRAHKRYRRSQSTSAVDILSDGTPIKTNEARDELTVNFGTGEVTGVIVEETVCLGAGVLQSHQAAENGTALSVPGSDTDLNVLPKGCQKLRMIQATAMSEEPFKTFKSDGVLGLGLAGLSLSNEYNFIAAFAGTVAELGGQPKMFAFFLGSGEEASELALGGYDDDHVDGDVHWNPVLDPEEGHWMIKVKAIRVDGVEVPFCEDGTCKAVLDSGTSLLAMPSKAFPVVYKRLWHRAALDGNCEGDGPQLDFEFEDFTVTMGPEDYSRPAQCKRPSTATTFQQDFNPFSSKGTHGPTRNDLCCRPMLMSVDMEAPIGPKLFLLGEPVLKKYYTVYDAENMKIGIGKARHGQSNKVPSQEDAEGDDDNDSWWDEEEDA